MNLKIESLLFELSHFWNLGLKKSGRVMAPLIAIPFVILGRLIYSLSSDIFYLSFFSFAAFLVLVTFVGYNSMPVEKRNQVVSCKVLGMTVGMAFVPIKIINLVVCFLMFHAMYQVCKHYLVKQNFYDSVIGKSETANSISNFKDIFSEFISCLIAGISTSVLFAVVNTISIIF